MDLKGACSRDIAWEVYTSAYRKVFASSTYVAGIGKIEWDLQDSHGRSVANGLYYLRVRAPQGDKMMRLMVLR